MAIKAIIVDENIEKTRLRRLKLLPPRTPILSLKSPRDITLIKKYALARRRRLSK